MGYFWDLRIFVLALGACGMILCDSSIGKAASAVIALVVTFGIYAGMHWYYTNTASGQRAVVTQKSDLANGLERTVTVYTADGEIIAQYTGFIDIQGNDGGYVLFDFEGKRYTYYNCFVESIANIE